MKKMVVRIIVAALIVAAGEAIRRAATIEDRLADAQEQLTTQTATVTAAMYDEVEGALAFAGRIPLVGDSLLADVREQRAVAAYWNGDYPAVTAAAPAIDDEAGDPDLMFLAANASYRTTIRSRAERAALLRGLDEALKRYSDVLDAEPGHGGAAYNYEFVARLRTALARGRNGGDSRERGPAEHARRGGRSAPGHEAARLQRHRPDASRRAPGPVRCRGGRSDEAQGVGGFCHGPRRRGGAEARNCSSSKSGGVTVKIARASVADVQPPRLRVSAARRSSSL